MTERSSYAEPGDPAVRRGALGDLVGRGFEVGVVKDATAGARLPGGDGYLAALVNFRFLASAVRITAQAVARLNKGEPPTSDLLNANKSTIEEAQHHGID